MSHEQNLKDLEGDYITIKRQRRDVLARMSERPLSHQTHVELIQEHTRLQEAEHALHDHLYKIYESNHTPITSRIWQRLLKQ